MIVMDYYFLGEVDVLALQDGELILLVNKGIRGDGYFADRLQETGQGMGARISALSSFFAYTIL